MSKANVLVSGGVALLVAVVVALVGGGSDGKDGRDGRDGMVGAVPVLNSPLEVSGAQLVIQGQRLNTASRTLCTIRTPNATTTGDFMWHIDNKEGYLFQVSAGYGTTAGATTTALGEGVNVLNKITSIATTSAAVLFPPNTYINLNVQATTSAVSSLFNPTGWCAFQGFGGL